MKNKNTVVEIPKPDGNFEEIFALAEQKKESELARVKEDLRVAKEKEELQKTSEIEVKHDERLKTLKEVMKFILDNDIANYSFDDIKKKLEVLTEAYKKQKAAEKKLKKESTKEVSLDLAEPNRVGQAAFDLSGEINKAKVNDE
jgi:hypothetical protein